LDDDESSYQDSNASDIEDELKREDDEDEEDKRMRLFPDLRYWVPEADSLARKRKTMKSYQDLLRPATPGKSRNSSGLDSCKV
jgi:hypothetical protein